MKALVLAPHPFFQERGTPIDVLLVLRVLSARANTDVDVLVYDEGEEIELPAVRLIRTRTFGLSRNLRPGFSFRKVLCDVLMFFKAWSLVRRNGYDIVHAGEEAVFFAMFFDYGYSLPYAYDLDSSIAQQLVERRPFLRVFAGMFNWMERQAIRRSLICFPVCLALADLCVSSGAKKVVTLHDISQLEFPMPPRDDALMSDLGRNRLLAVYIGNLEPYQGIDLLLDSFHLACQRAKNVDLVIIGGTEDAIAHYKRKAKELSVDGRTHFVGPKPFERLGEFLSSADILVCPRIRGINTPMKIFPYLHSGRAVLATDLITHNQLLSSDVVYLAPADPEGFASGLVALSQDPDLRARLGESGQAFVEQGHTFTAHSERLNSAYNWIESELERTHG